MNIVDLPDDQKITEPGFYRISLERHHSQPCDGVSVTSGVLRTMHLHSPSKVWATHKLNPDSYAPKNTDALRLGTAMAAFIEGGKDLLEAQYNRLPANKPKRPTEAQIEKYAAGESTEAGKKSVEFWRAVDADPRPIITDDELKKIVEMGTALSRDPAACAVLGGEPEITMATYDERSRLWFLARPDNVSFDGTMSDYKKISTQGRAFTHRLCGFRVREHGYDQQMGFAADVFARITSEWPDMAGLVFQEDTAPYDSILMPLDDEDLRIGKFYNDQAALRFRECLDSGYWPGPGENIVPFQRSEKERERILEEMQQAGAEL